MRLSFVRFIRPVMVADRMRDAVGPDICKEFAAQVHVPSGHVAFRSPTTGETTLVPFSNVAHATVETPATPPPIPDPPAKVISGKKPRKGEP